MKPGSAEEIDRPTAPPAPRSADVAALYVWAGLGDAPYVDFTASRRVHRAAVRAQAAAELAEAAESRGLGELPAPDADLPGREEIVHPERPRMPPPSPVGLSSGPRRVAVVRAPQPKPSAAPPASFAGTASIAPPARVSGGRENSAVSRETSIASLCPDVPLPPAAATTTTATALPERAPGLPVSRSPVSRSPGSRSPSSRWFALDGLLRSQPEPGVREVDAVPTLLLLSLAGGVGVTSLAATLGRTLAASGERVLLAEIGAYGMLSSFFGADETEAGAVRTFTPPPGSADAPVAVGCFRGEAARRPGEPIARQIAAAAHGLGRVVVDWAGGAGTAGGWGAVAALAPTPLVLLAPEMNSILSLRTLPERLAGLLDGAGMPLAPWYLLTRFDVGSHLHGDVREALRARLGERLLPFALPATPLIGEAHAQGMTVADYAPASAIAESVRQLAGWLQTHAPPAVAGFDKLRWKER